MPLILAFLSVSWEAAGVREGALEAQSKSTCMHVCVCVRACVSHAKCV